MTPEGKVKAKVSALLKQYGCYYFMPVQMGLGAAGLDYHCYKTVSNVAIAFFVETKAFGKEPTPRQQLSMDEHEARGARCFVVDSDLTLKELERWLREETIGCWIQSPKIF